MCFVVHPWLALARSFPDCNPRHHLFSCLPLSKQKVELQKAWQPLHNNNTATGDRPHQPASILSTGQLLPRARLAGYDPLSTPTRTRSQQRPGGLSSLVISTAAQHSTPMATTAATPHTLRSHDLSPLSPLEEQVFDHGVYNISNNNTQSNYSVFDDDTVMKMCDDDVDQAAAAIAAENAQQTVSGHGWRIDSVIDKYGNRIASRSKRLARMMGQRGKGNASLGDQWPPPPPPPPLPTAGSSGTSDTRLLAHHHSLRYESSNNGSSSTRGGAASTYSSPIGAPAELSEGYGTSAVATAAMASANANTSPHQKRLGHRRGGPAGKSRLHLKPQQQHHRFKRKQGSSLDSIPARHAAMALAHADDDAANNAEYDDNHSGNPNGSHGNQSLLFGSGSAGGGAHAAMGIDSGSFELADYSTGGSTSTILQKRGQENSSSSPMNRRRHRGHWWTAIFRNHARSASIASQHTPSTVAFPADVPRVGPRGIGLVSPPAGGIGGPFEQPPQSSRTTVGGGGVPRPGGADGKSAGGAQRAEPFGNAMHAARERITNFIMPGGYNRFGTRDEHTYTESIGFLLAFVLASVAFIMWGTLVPKALCSTNLTFTMNDIGSRKFVAANGVVSDFTLSHSSFGHAMRGFSGYDISTMFPLLGQLSESNWNNLSSGTRSLLSKCIASDTVASNFIKTWRANSTLYQGDLSDFPTKCPFPQAPQTSGAPCLTQGWSQFTSSKVGLLKINMTELRQRHSSPTTSWVIIDGLVFDVSTYVQYASSEIVVNGTVLADRQLLHESMFLPEALTSLFISKPGKDISSEFHSLSIDDVLYRRCMESLFFHGTTLTAKSPFACANTNLVAWVTFGFYFFVLFSRLVTAEVYATFRARKVVLSIPGFEGDPYAQFQSDEDSVDAGSGASDASAQDGTSNGSEHGIRQGDHSISPTPGKDDTYPYGQHKTSREEARSSEPQKQQQQLVEIESVSERHLEAGQANLGNGRSSSHASSKGTPSRKRHSTGRAPKCIVVIPCFHESIDVLTRTFQGIARSAYADTHKLLWIINDGDAEALDSILRIMAHSGRESDPKFYGAYGVDNGASYGSARVYAGFYECGRHRIPYVVTAKETYQGRVDTLMMVLNFFRSLSSSPRQQRSGEGLPDGSHQQQPQTIFLEEEVEARMASLGHAPSQIDYCLMLGGSLQIDPLAITQFVARMERNGSIIALSGTLYPVGRPSSLLHVLQYFEFYLRHFVSPICESLSNVTCPLNQLFTMYRVRLPSGDFCLGDEDLVASMDSLMKGSMRYRHLTWPGNDCLLVPRMVRRFPQYRWSFEPNGRAEVELTTHEMAAFDPYERQWFRTRLVTLFDMLRGRLLKRTWPVMLAHLLFPFVVPAASCMLYLEIVISCFGDSPAIVVSELTAAFVGATLLLLLATRRWNLALYFLVYSAIAVPFYHIWIPVTSLFSMNRVWYSPAQIAAQQVAAEAQVQPPENFEAMKNDYLRKFSNAAEKRRARRHRHSTSSLSSTSSGNEQQQQQQAQQAQQAQKQHGGVPGILAGHWRKNHSSGGSGKKVRIHSAGGGNQSSDSEPEFIEALADPPAKGHQPADAYSRGNGLGLNLGPATAALQSTTQQHQLARVVVSDPLMLETRAVLRQILREYPQGVEPESAEFYAVCERALTVLIPLYPSSSVAELAVAVDSCIDDLARPGHQLQQPGAAGPGADMHSGPGRQEGKGKESTSSSTGSHGAPHSATPTPTLDLVSPPDIAAGGNGAGRVRGGSRPDPAVVPLSAPNPGLNRHTPTTLPLPVPTVPQQAFVLSQPPPLGSPKRGNPGYVGRGRPVSVIMEESDSE
ncbi:hypothetical protein GQ54DRAFT_184758 [Martensiomyces pterosporus]|nr:hypothetical protein GQ54DRAFT_184758 [Martensiomyces pterosporus]